ncbi:MAG: phosphatase PAP2 family protein [Xanthobacteraceae bacterium]
MPGAADARDTWHRRAAVHVGQALRLLLRPARWRDPVLEPKRLAIFAVAAVVALILLSLIVDASAARGARALPHWLVNLFDDVTDFGKAGWFLWPIGILLLVMAALPDRLPARTRLTMIAIAIRLEFLFVAIAAPSLFATIVKRLIGRARPYIGGSLDPSYFSPLVWRSEFAAMPSGHATTAVAAAVAISTLWPRARTVAWIYALLIMASRVVLTAHYVTDVLAGAIVGAAGVILVRRYFADRRLGFSVTSAGGIVQYPVPSGRRVKAVARAALAE